MKFYLAILTLFPLLVLMVKQEDFKLCAQSSFCARQTAYADLVDAAQTPSPYVLVPDSTTLSKKGTLSFKINDNVANQLFQVRVEFLEMGALRFKMSEITNLQRRYDGVPEFSIISGYKLFESVVENKLSSNEIQFQHKDYILSIQAEPFKFHINTISGDRIFTFNDRKYFHFEHYRPETDQTLLQPANQTDTPAMAQLRLNIDKGMWKEDWKTFHDSKPKGPESIGIDFTLEGFENTYGLAEHTSKMVLQTTRGESKVYQEPYRLYNLDVFEYILDSPMALYGSIPYVFAHKKGRSVGILWVNAAEMWVHVEKTIKNSKNSTSFHWSAESGMLDLFILTGTSPKSVQEQLSVLTGKPAMPQLFATTYHQCRWNYNDQEDVLAVNKGFDDYDIPYDVLWLDIEHTDNKKYFTWDNKKFPDPVAMQKKLSYNGRKMITIIDPHIKIDSEYQVSQQAKDRDLFVKGNDGSSYSGWCWPGNSNWLDYTNPDARDYWAQQFLFDTYKGSSPTLYTWNDMNEPSVFSGPEITMLKDNKHHNGVEHRDVHNLYGMLQHMSTHQGHLLRSQNKDRPFVLSRAFFIGTQRYGAIWTGDNFARWDHMAASIPMLLSLGISGLPFVGADVGGFFGNPEPELLVRWYQLGAFQPFFRAHAHIDTSRREPWLFGEENTDLIRTAIQQRYRNMPYIYTLHREAHVKGTPIMRPMFYEFADDEKTFAMDEQYMFGSAFLVKAVVEPGVKNIEMYLPPSDIWYNYHSYEQVSGNGNGLAIIQTPIDKLPILIRGGSIIARKERLRSSSSLMKFDPYTLLIALDANGSASGSLYVDDGSSFEYENGKYIQTEFNFQNGTLTSKNVNTDGRAFITRIERLEIISAISSISYMSVSVKKPSAVNDIQFSQMVLPGGTSFTTVKNPTINVGEDWIIQLMF